MILQVKGLSKNYGSLSALSDFDLEVKKGQVLGILGPNGSGKTTALGIILGVTLPSKGSYHWFEEGKPSAKSRRRIGALLEQPNFYPWLSAFRNLEIVARIRDQENTITTDEIEEKLKAVGLRERQNDRVQEFSLGMKQRLALAAVLLGNPEVLVLDEPTNGLDARAIAEMRELILRIASEGKSILMASHILDEVEKICSHIVILQKGKTLARGAIKDVLASGNTFEIASDNLELLSELLKNFPACKKFNKMNSYFLAEFGSEMTAGRLNKYAFDNGIILSHLSKQSHGLESQFLKLLERNHA